MKLQIVPEVSLAPSAWISTLNDWLLEKIKIILTLCQLQWIPFWVVGLGRNIMSLCWLKCLIHIAYIKRSRDRFELAQALHAQCLEGQVIGSVTDWVEFYEPDLHPPPHPFRLCVQTNQINTHYLTGFDTKSAEHNELKESAMQRISSVGVPTLLPKLQWTR